MKTSRALAKWIPAMSVALFGLFIGSVREAQAVVAADTPMVKNLMAPTYRAPTAPAVAKEMNKKDAKRLAAVAELPAEHLKLARFYAAEANRLEALAISYEKAAAAYRERPAAKNLAAPTTVGLYEFLVKGFRSEEKRNRALATSHEEMAALY